MNHLLKIGAKIQARREQRGQTVRQLAMMSNVMEAIIEDAERGLVELFPSELRAIASALGLREVGYLRNG